MSLKHSIHPSAGSALVLFSVTVPSSRQNDRKQPEGGTHLAPNLKNATFKTMYQFDRAVCITCWLSPCPETSSCMWEHAAQEWGPICLPLRCSARPAGLYIGQISIKHLMGRHVSLLAACVVDNTVSCSLVTRKALLKQKDKGNTLFRHSQLFQNCYPQQSIISH